MSKYCVLYSYYETKESKKNLAFFLENGVSHNPDISYVFLINNHKCSVDLPNQENIKLIYRDNIGRDFGSWKQGLDNICTDKYQYFIFMNDTVMGPFLPRYIPLNAKWYVMFCCLLSDKVKLSGLTINYYPFRMNSPDLQHVQSMMFCTDKIGLEILQTQIFNLNLNEYHSIFKKSKKDYIKRFEIGMSQEIIKKGYELAALYVCDIKKYKTGDTWFNNNYFNTTINPMETMFIKKNRVNSTLIQFYTHTFSSNRFHHINM